MEVLPRDLERPAPVVELHATPPGLGVEGDHDARAAVQLELLVLLGREPVQLDTRTDELLGGQRGEW